MSNQLPLDAYAQDAALSIDELGSKLRSGSLGLVIGAGVSAGLGLPKWWELVRDCVQDAGLTDIVTANSSNDELKTLAGAVSRRVGSQFCDLVRRNLYKSNPDEWSFLGQKLLLAMGAMMMGSRRGSVTEVITFNFDDILERYLRLNGFSSQVITSLPTLRASADVTVYHPHGFLPSDPTLGTDGDELIFSRHSFDERTGDLLNAWTSVLRDLLSRKVVLFVGLSVQSDVLTAALANLKNGIQRSRGVTGFWLLGPGDSQTVDAELEEKNVVPVRMNSYDDFAPLLLRVCQSAANT